MVYRLVFRMCSYRGCRPACFFHLCSATAWLLGFGHISLSVRLHLKLPFFCKLFSSHSSASRTFLLFSFVIHGLPMTCPPLGISTSSWCLSCPVPDVMSYKSHTLINVTFFSGQMCSTQGSGEKPVVLRKVFSGPVCWKREILK